MARRDDREYREYLSEEQRRQRGPQRGSRVGVERGCIARRMRPDFRHGLLSAARLFAVTAILWTGVSVGCVVMSPVQPSQIRLGQSFELRVGASVIFVGGLTIRFDRVKSDSRCPMQTFCVWTGDAVVAVSLLQGSAGPVARELHTNAGGSEASYLDYSIKLLTLAPYPLSDREVRPGDYVATLEVTAR